MNSLTQIVLLLAALGLIIALLRLKGYDEPLNMNIATTELLSNPVR